MRATGCSYYRKQQPALAGLKETAAVVRHTSAETDTAAEPDAAADIAAAAAAAAAGTVTVADIVVAIVADSTAAAAVAAAAVAAAMSTCCPSAGTAADRMVRRNYFPSRRFQLEVGFADRDSCQLAWWEKQTIAVVVAVVVIGGITLRFVPESGESVLQLKLLRR